MGNVSKNPLLMLTIYKKNYEQFYIDIYLILIHFWSFSNSICNICPLTIENNISYISHIFIGQKHYLKLISKRYQISTNIKRFYTIIAYWAKNYYNLFILVGWFTRNMTRINIKGERVYFEYKHIPLSTFFAIPNCPYQN